MSWKASYLRNYRGNKWKDSPKFGWIMASAKRGHYFVYYCFFWGGETLSFDSLNVFFHVSRVRNSRCVALFRCFVLLCLSLNHQDMEHAMESLKREMAQAHHGTSSRRENDAKTLGRWSQRANGPTVARRKALLVGRRRKLHKPLKRSSLHKFALDLRKCWQLYNGFAAIVIVYI